MADYREINKNKKIANQEVFERISKLLNIPVEVVKEVVESQFEYAARVIKMGGLETIMIPYLGKFKINPRRVSKVTNNLNKTK